MNKRVSSIKYKVLGIQSTQYSILNTQNRGFTIIEIVVALGIVGMISVVVVSNFLDITKRTDLGGALQELVGVVELAQSKTLASEDSSQYGIYFDSVTSPHQYILFKGTSFAARDTSYDKRYSLPGTIEFFAISFVGGSEVIFNKLTGTTEQSGSVTLRLKSDTSQAKTLFISNTGAISFTASQPPADTRIKDSRHVYFDYSRNIDTANETITFTFDNTVTQTIAISQNLVAGQIQWEGTVSVGGQNQTVRVHTHRLNSPTSQFSIHRDRRLNSKSLKITISGDSSVSLAEYSADGLTTSYSSTHVSNFTWQ